ncbi:MAG: putative transcriptional regulator [Sphingobacteriales bacterium]|jgi:putative transcriptional regulator
MKIITQPPKAGKLLISEPFLVDPNFKRTVIYLTEHDEHGSVGFIMNKPLKTSLGSIIEELGSLDTHVYLGGPVQLDTLHFIHKIEAIKEGSVELSPGIYWGGDLELLKEYIKQNKVEKEDIRFFIGYSGWTEGQLTSEVKDNSWIVTKFQDNYLFNVASEKLWNKVLSDMGNDFKIISNFPEDPTLN